MPWLSVLKWGAPRRRRWIWSPLSRGWKCSSIFRTGSRSGWAAGSTRRRSCASGRRRSAVSTGHCPLARRVVSLLLTNSAQCGHAWALPCLCRPRAFHLRPVLNSEGFTFHFLHRKVTYSCSVTNEFGIPRNEACLLWRLCFYFPYIWEIGILSALNE